jgi:putative NADPH-quinone reductase
VKGAEASGNEVRLISLGKLSFDPVLHDGYAKIQPLEPDLVSAQSAISWAQHLVFVYPTWWGAMPALLKGFIDRIFLPGFAFKYREGSVFWDRLLAGRSAHLLVTMDSPPWYYRWVVRMPGHNQMKRAILEFSGIKPVTISNFGPVKSSTLQQREKWLSQTIQFGNRA